MKAILVDDEPLSLMQLQTLLESGKGGVEVVGAFSNPFQAIEAVRTLQPDVVFLDINMPGMNGLELGERLQASFPSPEIVFITGYNQYAVEAFELSAVDYIMKPVLQERLNKTVLRLQQRTIDAEGIARAPGKSLICCFTHIRFQMPGEEPQLIKWRTSKVQELFAYLLHHRGKMISRFEIIELLWPNYDLDRATQYLYTTIYNIRQTLRLSGLETVSIESGGLDSGYMLSLGNAGVDCEEWENQLKQLSTVDDHHVGDHRSILQMYTGDYFGDYDFMWAENERERLRRLWLQHAYQLSQFLEENVMIEDAIQVNTLIQQRDAFEEESYFRLMKCYQLLGKRGAVEDQYRLLTEVLEKELGCKPSSKISSWYETWRNEG